MCTPTNLRSVFRKAPTALTASTSVSDLPIILTPTGSQAFPSLVLRVCTHLPFSRAPVGGPPGTPILLFGSCQCWQRGVLLAAQWGSNEVSAELKWTTGKE
eukprot:6206364-Pleurochrysis_carterae.AAC.1